MSSAPEFVEPKSKFEHVRNVNSTVLDGRNDAPFEEPATPPEGLVIERQNAEVQLMLDPADGEKHANIQDLKMAKDGVTILVPQPSTDPHDPLNWSSWKKHFILVTLAMGGFVTDFSSGVGIPAVGVQAEEWDVTVQDMINTVNINTLMIGLGGIFCTPIIYYWGKAPLFYWSLIIGTFFTMGCALAQTYTAFYALRCLQTFFLTTGQTMGLAVIKDMFFYHEHPRKIGLYICIFYCSPYLGPQFSGWMLSGLNEWRPAFWLSFGLGMGVVMMATVFMEETTYDRANPPKRDDNVFRRRFRDLMGLGFLTESRLPIGRSYMRLVSTWSKPIMIPMMIWFGLTFMWAIGINATSSQIIGAPPPTGYGYSLNDVAYMYFVPIVALIIGELIGHWLNDIVAYFFIKRNHGIFVPEVRLWPNWIALALMVPGLVIVGQTLQFHWNVAGIIIPWGMYVVGVMINAVSGTAYVLDCYPNAAGEVMTLMNLARILLGMSVGFYQTKWGLDDGYNVSFGIQAAIVAGSYSIIIILQLFGPHLRRWGGPLRL